MRSLLEQNTGRSKIQEGKDKCQAIVNVQQFAPEEIQVKTGDNSMVIKGKQKSVSKGSWSYKESKAYIC